MSPLLFSMFLNDMSEFILHAYQGLDVLKDCTSQMLSDDDIEVYLKLYLLLYADDTIIMAESECELQAALNAAHHYCTLWKLVINTQRTKLMIFSSGKSRNIPKFHYNGLPFEVVTDYRYLDIDFNYNGKFNTSFRTGTKSYVVFYEKLKTCVFL